MMALSLKTSEDTHLPGHIDCVRHWYSCGLPVGVPLRRGRAVLLLITSVTNFVSLLYGVIAVPSDVGTFLLAIMIVNFLIYFQAYVVRLNYNPVSRGNAGLQRRPSGDLNL
jgi:hypothetical protein